MQSTFGIQPKMTLISLVTKIMQNVKGSEDGNTSTYFLETADLKYIYSESKKGHYSVKLS